MSLLRRTGNNRNNIDWYNASSNSSGKYLRRTGTSRNNISWLQVSTSGTYNLLNRTSNGRNNIQWKNTTFSFFDLRNYSLMPQYKFLTNWCAQIVIKCGYTWEVGARTSSIEQKAYNITGTYTLGDYSAGSEGGMIVHYESNSIRDTAYNACRSISKCTIKYGSTTKNLSITKIYKGESQLVINNGTSNYGTAYWNCFVIPEYWPSNLSRVQFE